MPVRSLTWLAEKHAHKRARSTLREALVEVVGIAIRSPQLKAAALAMALQSDGATLLTPPPTEGLPHVGGVREDDMTGV